MSEFPSILPSNCTVVEAALEQALHRGDPDLSPIASLMNPNTCPVNVLGWLAWAFSVDEWNPDWDEAHRREVIRTSIQVHRIKGTRGAVRRALQSIGFRTDISEWFEHGGVPHTFRIDAFGADVVASGEQVDAALVEQLTSLIENVKPIRSHFELRIGESFNTRSTAKVGINQKRCLKVDLSPQPRLQGIKLVTETRLGLRHGLRQTQILVPQPQSDSVVPRLRVVVGQRQHFRKKTTLSIIPREGASYVG